MKHFNKKQAKQTKVKNELKNNVDRIDLYMKNDLILT